MSLADLDELVMSCRTEQARAYIAEAVASYKAGAYRAAIVATWIAVVYDLLAKVRELAVGGDGAAQSIVTELGTLQPRVEAGDQSAIRRILDIERTIVQVANDKFGFFDGQQLIDLNRLAADRNRCAHPTYQGAEQPYLPTAELARSHLAHAVRHVLGVAPVQGKAATAQIVRLVESPLFPSDVEQAKVQLKAGGLDRPREALVRTVVDHLVFGLFEGNANLKRLPRAVTAIVACFELFPAAAEARLRHTLNSLGRRLGVDDLYTFFGLLRRLPSSWSFLEGDNQHRLTELIKQAPGNRASQLIPIALTIPDLQQVSVERIGTLEPEDLSFLLQRTKHEAAVERAVDLYCSSKSWDQANNRYTRNIEPILNELTADQIERIFAASTAEGADLDGAHSFSEFVRYVYDKERLPKEDVVASLKGKGMGWIADQLIASDTDDNEITF